MEKVNGAWLQTIEPLKDVPIGQLDWLADNSEHYIIPEGGHLFKKGDPISGTHVLVSGGIRIFVMQNNSLREIDMIGPKDVTGYLPFSRGKIAFGFGQATEDTQVMTFPVERARELITTHFELTQALVHMMTTRVRETVEWQQQNEKMMALGKLSAGLAHELNNPAAAIVRGSASLKQHLGLQPETFKDVMAIQLTPEKVDIVTTIMHRIMESSTHEKLSLMDRTDCEDELTDWMDAHGIKNSYDIAENFVEFGFRLPHLEEMATQISGKDLSPVFNWINNNLVTERMVNDIQEASQRISELVSSVKNFTHMDRAGDMQFTDIHSGLRNTLTMLNHKIKKGSVEITEQFDTTLPEVKAMIGELNQVWTNIIDNALDAMEGRENSKLKITTMREREFVKVEIADNGPGIPEEIVSSIFDPFFTTKEMGKGTGLGLDVVNRIVRQHNGSIKVTSVPGNTVFTVCFPMNAN